MSRHFPGEVLRIASIFPWPVDVRYSAENEAFFDDTPDIGIT